MPPEPTSLTRRRLLATAGAVGIATAAGCAGRSPSDGVGNSGATDIVLHNAAARSLTVTVTATPTDADPEADGSRLDRTVAIGAGETIDAVNRAKLPTTHDYTVTVVVADGPEETFEWSDPTVERAPLWVFLDGSRNVKFLLQAG